MLCDALHSIAPSVSSQHIQTSIHIPNPYTHASPSRLPAHPISRLTLINSPRGVSPPLLSPRLSSKLASPPPPTIALLRKIEEKKDRERIVAFSACACASIALRCVAQHCTMYIHKYTSMYLSMYVQYRICCTHSYLPSARSPVRLPSVCAMPFLPSESPLH